MFRWWLTVVALACSPAAGRGQTPADDGIGDLQRELSVAQHVQAIVAIRLGDPSGREASDVELAAEISRIVAGEALDPRPRAAAPVTRIEELFERTEELRRKIYDIYAEADSGDVAGAAEAVEAAIDAYLASGAPALSPAPKSMEILGLSGGPTAFEQRYRTTVTRLWTVEWLQLAALEPLLLHSDELRRNEAARTVLGRFGEMMTNGTTGRAPTHMPMAPAIAPELVARHPRAAAIFDNLNMARGLYLNLLVRDQGAPVPGSIDRLIEDLIDPQHLAIGEIEWIIMSLRHGIYAQGGPASGGLERSERNEGGHHGAHSGGSRTPLPGM